MKNSVALIAGVALLAVGYTCGAYVGYPLVEQDMLEGNISKAKVYNQAESPEVLAVMEQLANDTTYQKDMLFSSTLLNGRVLQMDELVKATLKATEGIEELKGLNELMAASSKRTANAAATYETYLNEMIKVMNGEKSESYEQAQNNAMMAFLSLESSLNNVPEMINSMICYTEATPNETLCNLMGQWAQYSAENAVLNGSAEDIAYWETAYNTLNNMPQLQGRALAAFPSVESTILNLYHGPVNAKEILSLYHGPVNAKEILGLYHGPVNAKQALELYHGPVNAKQALELYHGPVNAKQALKLYHGPVNSILVVE